MAIPETGEPESRPEKVTIYEVARRSGVSIATVSHALNRPNRVRASTRERVLDVVDELDFVPKAAAVSLARKAVQRIGVLAPFTSYRSYATRLNGVLEACTARGVQTIVFDAPSVASAESPLLDTLPTTGDLDGLLIMGFPLEDRAADRLRRRKLLTVLVDSVHKGFHSVNVDDEAGGHAAASHLVERGHRRFAFVSEGQQSPAYVSQGERRVRGFVNGLRDAGIDPAAMNWSVTTNDIRGGRDAAADLLSRPEPPTAFFCHHDDLAAGVLAELRGARKAVPSEVAVVGYDDSDIAEALDLTSVHQPFAETGRLAAHLLFDAMGAPNQATRHINLAPHLTVRETT